MAGRTLCRLDEIEDGNAKGFDPPDGADGEAGLFVVRRGDRLFGYVNNCPHWHITLDYVPGRFMNLDKNVIQCSNHGARFTIETGLCIWGPCRGEALEPVALTVVDGEVRTEE